MFSNKIKINFVFAAAGLITLSSCEKGGAQFSISSDQAVYQQSLTFIPRKVDVLFVIDNSGSMRTSQESLAQNFPSFINYFKNKGYDFKIAVTTTDAFYGQQFLGVSCGLCNVGQTQFRTSTDTTTGQPFPRVLDNNTVDLERAFSTIAQVGTTGSGDERAFSSFKAALESPLNTGFHRSDAYLSVVIVSDEEDFSYGLNDDVAHMNINESYANPLLHSVASYKDFLMTFTGGQPTADFSVSTISILDSACRTQLGSGRKIATRYMELADLTGGSKNSLCGAFNTALDNISATIANQTLANFPLSRIPVVESIRVIIDGIVIAQDYVNGWTYDSVSNSITIRGSASPQAGAVISINFDPAGIDQ